MDDPILILRSSNPEPRMSLEGYERWLPRRNVDDRWTSINGHFASTTMMGSTPSSAAISIAVPTK
jgi:hypothetical protein